MVELRTLVSPNNKGLHADSVRGRSRTLLMMKIRLAYFSKKNTNTRTVRGSSREADGRIILELNVISVQLNTMSQL